MANLPTAPYRRSSLPIIFNIFAWVCVAAGAIVIVGGDGRPSIIGLSFASGAFFSALFFAALARLLRYGERCANAAEELVRLHTPGSVKTGTAD